MNTITSKTRIERRSTRTTSPNAVMNRFKEAVLGDGVAPIDLMVNVRMGEKKRYLLEVTDIRDGIDEQRIVAKADCRSPKPLMLVLVGLVNWNHDRRIARERLLALETVSVKKVKKVVVKKTVKKKKMKRDPNFPYIIWLLEDALGSYKYDETSMTGFWDTNIEKAICDHIANLITSVRQIKKGILKDKYIVRGERNDVRIVGEFEINGEIERFNLVMLSVNDEIAPYDGEEHNYNSDMMRDLIGLIGHKIKKVEDAY